MDGEELAPPDMNTYLKSLKLKSCDISAWMHTENNESKKKPRDRSNCICKFSMQKHSELQLNWVKMDVLTSDVWITISLHGKI